MKLLTKHFLSNILLFVIVNNVFADEIINSLERAKKYYAQKEYNNALSEIQGIEVSPSKDKGATKKPLQPEEEFKQYDKIRRNEEKYRGSEVTWRIRVGDVIYSNPDYKEGYVEDNYSCFVWIYRFANPETKKILNKVFKGDYIIVTGEVAWVNDDGQIALKPKKIITEE